MENEAKLREEVEKTKIERALNDEEYVAELEGMSKVELEQKLLGLAKHEQEIISTKNNDDELNAAKRKASVLGSPYREQLKFNKLKARLVNLILKEKYEF